MIFLSLGTHEQPFHRAVETVRALAESGEPVVIQHGSTPPDPSVPNATWHEFVGYEEMVETIASCRAFVCHAGVGSILTALSYGVTPAVVPRMAVHGEHVDDHQLQLVGKLVERNLIVLVEDDVIAAINRAVALRGRQRGPGVGLRAAIAGATGALAATQSSTR